MSNAFCLGNNFGKVYLIAGQSNAGNSQDKRLVIDDRNGRVGAYDYERNEWRIADDPQPQGGLPTPGRDAEWGSIWPAAMNLLLPALGAPIGLITTTIFCEPVAAWLDNPKPIDAIAQGAEVVGNRFNAILWQHGESDVIAKTHRNNYLRAFRELRSRVAHRIGTEPQWIIATSTHHPTVYDDPPAEAEIRAALQEAAHEPHCFVGPDTDLLKGVCRSPIGRSQHFSEAGQRVAGAMWFSSLLEHFHDPKAKLPISD